MRNPRSITPNIPGSIHREILGEIFRDQPNVVSDGIPDRFPGEMLVQK